MSSKFVDGIPDILWAQCTACNNWQEPIATPFQVDHFEEFIRKEAITPAIAAQVLLGDDINISKMAKAMHDGPLGADDHWFSASTETGSWCVEMARAALKALTQEEDAPCQL